MTCDATRHPTRPGSGRDALPDRLHDDLLPLLAVARQDALEGVPHEQLVRTLDEALQVTRELMTDAHPGTGFQALEDAIEAVARPLCTQGELALAVDLDFDCRELSAQQYAVVLAGVRELVQNVEHHAHAARVRVEGTRGPKGWEVAVVDDGDGIDSAQAEQRRLDGHLGHRRLRQQLKLAGGRLVLDSGLAGTRATLHLAADAAEVAV